MRGKKHDECTPNFNSFYMKNLFTKKIWKAGVGCIVLALLQACSTTKNLPEGEQLYVGIEEINYQDDLMKIVGQEWLDSVNSQRSSEYSTERADRLLRERPVRERVFANEKFDYKQLTKEQQAVFGQKLAQAKVDLDLAQEEVEAVLAYPPNNSLFGSSSHRVPFPLGLWLYNGLVNSKNAVGKWAFRTFAATPVYVSKVSPEMRARVATNTLHNYGYFRGLVEPEVLPQKNLRKAKISYKVYAGPLSRLDSIAYLNFSPAADSLLSSTRWQRLLRKGDAFSVVNLAEEQSRIEKLFRENGYYYYAAPYTTFRADTLQRPHKVQLQVLPAADIPEHAKRQWYIGHVYVTIRNNDKEFLNRVENRRNYTYYYAGSKIPLRVGMWRRSIAHRNGELFRLSHQDLTLEKLNGLGIFSQMEVRYEPRDNSPECDTLDLFISTVMDKLYDASFEMNATYKSNRQLGPGISLGIAKRNAFRGGEKVSFDIFGSYEWQTGAGRDAHNKLLNSYELGTKLSFEFPRVVFPGVGRKHLRIPATTVFSLNSDWKNRAGFFNMVNLGMDATYKWSYNRASQHELTLLSLDFDKMLHTTASFDSIMAANPALHASMRDQFVPSLSYTYTYVPKRKHRNPIWFQISVKEAGNVASGIYALCGQKFSKPDKELFNNPFAQFVKATAEFRETFRINRRYYIASRLYAGCIYSYGNSKRAPYSDQFYVGGANSVRGFTVRAIGPGGYRSAESKYAYIDQTGDIRLEANVEFRALLFGMLHGAVFFDAGNVWLMREDPLRPNAKFCSDNLKRIAVGTGLGLRLDLDFFVVRFDVGVPLHAPYDTGKSGWYNIPKLGRNLAYHLAVGYPF